MHPQTDYEKGQEMTENQTDENVEEIEQDEPVFPGTQVDDDGGAPGNTTDDDAETFPRDYVVKLRDENAKYRQRAADRDEIAGRLHTALVAATGRLADPTDLPFDDAHLSDPDALTAAVDALLQAKPHLASRKPTGDIGQGVSAASDSFSLSALLKTNAN